MYPDENHGLFGVIRHQHLTMEAFFDQVFWPKSDYFQVRFSFFFVFGFLIFQTRLFHCIVLFAGWYEETFILWLLLHGSRQPPGGHQEGEGGLSRMLITKILQMSKMRKKKRYSKIGTLKKGENDWRIKKKPTKKITFPFLIVLRGAIERMYTHFYIYVRRT